MTFRSKAAAVVFLAAGYAALAVSAPLGQKAAGEKPRSGGIFRIKSYSSRFNPVFDPAAPGAHAFIIEQLYDGLVRLNRNLDIIPALAEYWVVSDEGRKIKFYLRRDVRFHHGAELTAEDVKYSLERLARMRPGNVYYAYFIDKVRGAEEFTLGRASEVAGFRVLEKYVFEIEWLRPYVSGLYFLAMPLGKVLPRDRLAAEGDGFFDKPSGTGPFRFAFWVRSPRLEILGVRLERNGSYFGRKPYLDALEYRTDFTEAQFEAGDVHAMPPESEDLLQGRYQVLENILMRGVFLGLSGSRPPLDRPVVRRALALAVDKTRLAGEAYTPALSAQVTDNFIPASLPGFFPHEGVRPDLEKARRLLAEAGETPGPETPTLLLPKTPDTAVPNGVYRELVKQVEALGFRVEIRTVPSLEAAAELQAPTLTLLDWTLDFPDPEDIVMPLFSSRAYLNDLVFQYANPRLDKILERSEVEASWETRTRLFREMEEILRADAPAVPLYTFKVRLVLQTGVRGARLPALGFFLLDMKEIWLGR
jgi:ABC-type transport system substrate-binding protein